MANPHYPQLISGPGELTRAKQAKHQLAILGALYTATDASGKVDITSALATANTAIDDLITAIED